MGWPKPRGFHPDLELNPPKKLNTGEILWQNLQLSDEEISLKKKAISFYKSQNKSAPSYLFTFARKNELFGDFPVIHLKKQKPKEIDWRSSEENKNDKEISQDKEKNKEILISGLTYAFNENSLFVRLDLKRRISKPLGILLYLFGYNKKTAARHSSYTSSQGRSPGKDSCNIVRRSR